MEWFLFQLPAEVSLTTLHGQQIDLEANPLQKLNGVEVLVTQPPSNHMFPLKDKKGKIKIAGKFTKSLQVLKTLKTTKKRKDRSA